MLLLTKENTDYLNGFKELLEDFFSGQLKGRKLYELQNEKLRKNLKYVYNNSQFYGRVFEKYKESLNTYTIDTFQELPFTTKDDLRSEDLNMLSRPINENAFYYETTGTTGNATPCPRNMVDVISSNLTISMAYRHVFESIFGKKKPIVGIFGPTELHSFGDTLENICHNLDFCVVKAWPYSPVIGFKKTLEVMKKLKIDVIMTTPGLSMTLIKAARKHNYDPRKDFNVKMLMLTGEMCTDPMIKNIETIWKAKAFNFLYGSQEALVISTCDKNNKMHIFPHNYIYEIIDPDTRRFVGFQGEGELVVTMLNPGGKPLIRYRTGDLVRITAAADNNIPSDEIEIMGRVKDKIELNNRRFKASEFEIGIMSNIHNCLGYQIFIDAESGEDVLEIKIEMASKDDEIITILKDIETYFKEKLKIRTKVLFSDELSPVIYTGALISWKAARIVDRRRKNENDMEKESAERVIKDKIVKTE